MVTTDSHYRTCLGYGKPSLFKEPLPGLAHRCCPANGACTEADGSGQDLLNPMPECAAFPSTDGCTDGRLCSRVPIPHVVKRDGGHQS